MSYTLEQAKFIRDLNCECRIYVHDKTGAKAVMMPADDTNRAISIAFSTPPENDKGIPHIIEHSVLCGSKKYPLKDPFVQLMKGSMYSFLNAMTFSDFTVYPVASTNEKDFKNLADVYLDAAFNPLMPSKKEVFLQEGKHYLLDEKEENVLSFNGVVFNEMRGAEGGVDMHIENAVTSALFKETPYQYESGGLPLAIGDLTYEELTDFYRRHYTASNCVIFLYGKIDESFLDYIDREYLSKYEKSERYVIGEISEENDIEETKAPYPASKDDKEKGYYFTYNFALHHEHSPLFYLTLRVLDRILCSSQGAYLKQEMQKNAVGEDFYSNVDEIIKCPYFGFVSAYCLENDKAKFKEIIDTTLTKIVSEGIDKDRLMSSISKLEFLEKEAADGWTPKGITYALQMLPKFLYQENDPLSMLEFFDAIDELKELAKTDYFERFIEDYFINNKHKTLITIYPDTEFTSREDELLAKKCRENAARYEMSELVSDFHLLNEYRHSEDTPENIEKIPLLERGDLSVSTNDTETEQIDLGDTKLLYQKKNTNGIAYFSYLYDLRKLDPSLLPYFRMFTELFGAMNTKQHTYAQLSDLIDRHTGAITHTLLTTDSVKPDGETTPYMMWHSKFLYENADKAFSINKEILLDTDFSDTAHIYDMLLALKTDYARDLTDASHIQAREIGLSAYSEKSAYDYLLRGYGFYRLLCDTVSHFEEKKEQLVDSLESIRKALLDRSAWKFIYIGEAAFLEEAKEQTKRFSSLLTVETSGNINRDIRLNEKAAKAFCSPSQVQYAALCGKLPLNAREVRGYLLVAEHLINTDYLWHQVRVLGGAYGCFANFAYNGDTCMVSYRDPKLDETIATYRNVTEYLKNVELDERNLRQFIIGAMNKLDKPKEPYAQGIAKIIGDLNGITTEETERIRSQIINTSLDDIKALIPLINDWIQNATETVIGNEEKINSSELKFASVENLI